MGDQDGARDDFERAIELTPAGRHRAGLYLYVGQLSLEEEALEAYEKGIQELEQAIAAGADETDEVTMGDDEEETTPESLKKDLQQQLVRAHCTLAELYLTDLCFADNAEKECESHVEKAMQLTPEPLVDALQVMTSLRLSQQKDATPFILQAYGQIKTGCEALATLVGLHVTNKDDEAAEETAVELTEVDAVNNLPGFEFRCQTSKLLLECFSLSENEECGLAAIQVLGSLLAENDEVVETWYLLGCAFELQNDSDDLAVQYFQQALEMLQKVQEGLKQEDEDDDDVMQQLNECEGQIKDIQNKLKRIEEAETGKAEGAPAAETEMDES
jgi:tetratricopeptide (TPR) repeat protein